MLLLDLDYVQPIINSKINNLGILNYNLELHIFLIVCLRQVTKGYNSPICFCILKLP
jgi:hypothetical protein